MKIWRSSSLLNSKIQSWNYQKLLKVQKIWLTDLLGDVILKVRVTVTDVRNIAWQAHESLRLLADIPQNFRNGVPQGHNLLRLGRLQKFLQRDRFLFRAVVKDKVFDDERLDDRLQTASSVLRASEAERILPRMMAVRNPCTSPLASWWRAGRAENCRGNWTKTL